MVRIKYNLPISKRSDLRSKKKTIIYQEYKSKNYIHRLEDAECVKIKHPTISTIAELSILHLLFLHGPESFKLFDLL